MTPISPTPTAEAERIELATLLREVVEKGLIYWDPVTERGHAAKADMVRRCEIAIAAAQRPAAPVDRETFQARVDPWLIACFGETIARDRMERNHRFLEEALELVQSNGCTAVEAHQLVDYVFGRPVGDPHQEVGGVMVTLAALCLASGIDMHDAAKVELARVWTKVEAIRAKQAAKPKYSPLPVATRAALDQEGGRDG